MNLIVEMTFLIGLGKHFQSYHVVEAVLDAPESQ